MNPKEGYEPYHLDLLPEGLLGQALVHGGDVDLRKAQHVAELRKPRKFALIPLHLHCTGTYTLNAILDVITLSHT